MFKVITAASDAVLRKILCDLPWERYGFTCTGDAADGELALPMIRQRAPDLLICEVEMPYMGGLELGRLLRREFPDLKIILVSAADSGEYARAAIEIGVEGYLLKPISEQTLGPVLKQISKKLVIERERLDSMERLHQKEQEYAQFARLRFFSRLISGQQSAAALYGEAQALHIDLNSFSYSIVLYCFDNGALAVQQELELFLHHCPQFLAFQLGAGLCAVLVQADEGRIRRETDFCLQSIRRRFDSLEGGCEWYVACGSPVNRLSDVADSFHEAARILSYRHLCTGQHELTEESLVALRRNDTGKLVEDLELSVLSPPVFQAFLQDGVIDELPIFVEQYLSSVGGAAMGSPLFCQYLMLHVRFIASAYVESLHLDRRELTKALDVLPPIERLFGLDNVRRYFLLLLSRALELRDAVLRSRYHDAVIRATRYIDKHYADPELTVNETAGHAQVSASYLSTLFRQELSTTFVEYLTKKRLEQAKALLRDTRMRSGEIARAVGYNNSHYFSALFRKTQHCTPSAYRAKHKA